MSNQFSAKKRNISETMCGLFTAMCGGGQLSAPVVELTKNPAYQERLGALLNKGGFFKSPFMGIEIVALGVMSQQVVDKSSEDKNWVPRFILREEERQSEYQDVMDVSKFIPAKGEDLVAEATSINELGDKEKLDRDLWRLLMVALFEALGLPNIEDIVHAVWEQEGDHANARDLNYPWMMAYAMDRFFKKEMTPRSGSTDESVTNNLFARGLVKDNAIILLRGLINHVKENVKRRATNRALQKCPLVGGNVLGPPNGIMSCSPERPVVLPNYITGKLIDASIEFPEVNEEEIRRYFVQLKELIISRSDKLNAQDIGIHDRLVAVESAVQQVNISEMSRAVQQQGDRMGLLESEHTEQGQALTIRCDRLQNEMSTGLTSVNNEVGNLRNQASSANNEVVANLSALDAKVSELSGKVDSTQFAQGIAGQAAAEPASDDSIRMFMGRLTELERSATESKSYLQSQVDSLKAELTTAKENTQILVNNSYNNLQERLASSKANLEASISDVAREATNAAQLASESNLSAHNSKGLHDGFSLMSTRFDEMTAEIAAMKTTAPPLGPVAAKTAGGNTIELNTRTDRVAAELAQLTKSVETQLRDNGEAHLRDIALLDTAVTSRVKTASDVSAAAIAGLDKRIRDLAATSDATKKVVAEQGKARPVKQSMKDELEAVKSELTATLSSQIVTAIAQSEKKFTDMEPRERKEQRREDQYDGELSPAVIDALFQITGDLREVGHTTLESVHNNLLNLASEMDNVKLSATSEVLSKKANGGEDTSSISDEVSVALSYAIGRASDIELIKKGLVANECFSFQHLLALFSRTDKKVFETIGFSQVERYKMTSLLAKAFDMSNSMCIDPFVPESWVAAIKHQLCADPRDVVQEIERALCPNQVSLDEDPEYMKRKNALKAAFAAFAKWMEEINASDDGAKPLDGASTTASSIPFNTRFGVALKARAAGASCAHPLTEKAIVAASEFASYLLLRDKSATDYRVWFETGVRAAVMDASPKPLKTIFALAKEWTIAKAKTQEAAPPVWVTKSSNTRSTAGGTTGASGQSGSSTSRRNNNRGSAGGRSRGGGPGYNPRGGGGRGGGYGNQSAAGGGAVSAYDTSNNSYSQPQQQFPPNYSNNPPGNQAAAAGYPLHNSSGQRHY